MIVCHCNTITDHEIRAAVEWMRAADQQTVITPGKIYRALGKRADCGGCLQLFLDTMQSSPSLKVPMQLRGLRRRSTQDKSNEGRYQGY
ncbi:(2Fe-2S)-binding protein [Sedimentitalea sp. JM2-8]|uniref:(2Fe-2S)-binding protein n=1 Tax=Sedimentitalea xiamensis TaxID=3050037 RepID=A0ABT7FI35_9RHOB|nr:(2Fe-2S)-binding protein [Sedimentitalea xiamensis]MDK3074598.1 (2Fe-2S)-binding protein [Sedimentitalea xiamensis]